MSQDYSEILEKISILPTLKVEHFQEIRDNAQARMLELIGNRPDPKEYKVESLTLFTFMDWIIFALYIVLLLFSLIHVFLWAGKEAAVSYLALAPELQTNDILSVTDYGLQIGRGAYVISHQISLLGVSEIGIVALSMLHAYRSRYEIGVLSSGVSILEWVSYHMNRYFFLILALLCASVVFIANMNSDFNVFVSLLIPVLTISLSERFSQLFSKSYQSQLDAEVRYKRDVEQWVKYHDDPTQHPEFMTTLGGYIVEFYKRRKLGKEFEDWSKTVEDTLAAREIRIHYSRKNGIEAAMEFLGNPT